MQPQALLAATGQQLRHTPSAWTAGLLGAAGNILLGFWLRQALRPALWREPLRIWWESQLIPVTPLLVWGGGTVLLVLLAWLLALGAEGALIAIVLGSQHPWRQARQWLPRFVAIDSVVFLPLLLFALAVLVLLVTVLAGSLLVALGSAEPRAILMGGGLALLCATPAALLAIPVALVTVLLRLFAFRAAAIEGLGALPAVRRAWSMIRNAPGATALISILLWGLAYGAGTVLSTLFLLLHFVVALPEVTLVQVGRWALFLQSGLALLEWVPRAALFAFLGLGWTHAYRQLTGREAAV